MAGWKAHSAKQELVVFGQKRITIAASGIQWGKTNSGVAWLKTQMHRYCQANDNFLITSPSYRILTQSTLPPFLDVNKNCGKLDKMEWAFKMHGGGKVWFRTGTQPDSVVGITNVRAILCDEAGKYSRYFWYNIQARASFKKAPIRIVTSPYSLNWLYQDYIRPMQKGDEYVHGLCDLVQARSNENPYFPEGEYEDRRRTMDVRRFNMIYGGQFDKAEGLVYDCFSDDTHVCDAFALPKDTLYYGGIDWGYRDPFVIVIRAVTPLGMHYQCAEYVAPQKTISQIKEAAWRLKELFGVKMFYADPSRPDYINELCSAGITTIAAQNDIRIGLDSHYELIKEGRYNIFRGTSPFTLDEYEQYHYPELKDLKPDQNQKDELPVDQCNHTMDANRYVTMATYKRYGQRPNRIYTHSDIYDLKKGSESVHYDSRVKELYKTPKKNNHIL